MTEYTNTFIEDMNVPLGIVQRAWLRRLMILVLTPIVFILEGLGGICTTYNETFTFIKENW